MRGRVLVMAAVAAALALYLIRAAGGPDGSSAAPDSVRTAAPTRAVAGPVASPSSSLRNVFEYAEASVRAAGPPLAVRSVAPRVVTEPSVPLPPPPPAVRLVGLLRRGSHLKAALAITGETYVLGSGESAAGYTVVGIDEDEGVRVKMPD
ncbi:MAG TPA: hypothetical protein VFE68_04105, partial [Vicinamibacteria bacterium]|nr:hypothetical protein [Vicinamibacteria bacterium]